MIVSDNGIHLECGAALEQTVSGGMALHQNQARQIITTWLADYKHGEAAFLARLQEGRING
jgi:hypothetical protein